ncbi:MAG TPA: histidine phosphatase family protein, partial [Vicinamibacterales bacterium]|nr:histidine phosphatase family protein [Vicinamibacterales bacterium]
MEPEQFELYLIRHGLAAERGDQFPDDTKRPLTSRGIQRMKRAGKALVALDVAFDVILTSPLVRTRQTAEAVASAFK